jgi:general secretion pathway protein I
MLKTNNHSGFTLLEVLVALVMLATAFTAIYLSLSTATRNQTAIFNKTAATWVGLNVIAEAQLGTTQSSQNSGTTTMMNMSWHWQSVIKNTPDANVNQIIVAVSAENTKDPAIQLTGFLFNKSTSA